MKILQVYLGYNLTLGRAAYEEYQPEPGKEISSCDILLETFRGGGLNMERILVTGGGGFIRSQLWQN